MIEHHGRIVSKSACRFFQLLGEEMPLAKVREIIEVWRGSWEDKTVEDFAKAHIELAVSLGFWPEEVAELQRRAAEDAKVAAEKLLNDCRQLTRRNNDLATEVRELRKQLDERRTLEMRDFRELYFNKETGVSWRDVD